MNPVQGKPADNRRSSQWSSIRAAWIKQHPSCAACGTRESVEVHHKLPFHFPGGNKTELDPDNFISLCERPSWNCHLRIGHSGNWQARNQHVVEDAALSLERIIEREYPDHEANIQPVQSVAHH